MPLTVAEVQEIALLARLELSDTEAARLQQDLTAILGYIEKLQALDTEGVEPMTHAVPMDCPLRDDGAGPSLTPDEALAAAPKRADDFFEVPKIIEAGE
jgi:aspartyl-tRNA(Asn)/glutamyl-tRNA(Gln) amidotransferase subunit C